MTKKISAYVFIIIFEIFVQILHSSNSWKKYVHSYLNTFLLFIKIVKILIEDNWTRSTRITTKEIVTKRCRSSSSYACKQTCTPLKRGRQISKGGAKLKTKLDFIKTKTHFKPHTTSVLSYNLKNSNHLYIHLYIHSRKYKGRSFFIQTVETVMGKGSLL